VLPAVLTVLLWAVSATCSSRTSRHLGGPRANRWRLVIAAALLGIVVHAWIGLPQGSAVPWLLLSGAIGLGLGDLAMFAAYERIGARLTVLMTQCLAVPVAGTLEWAWLGHAMQPAEIGWCAVIMAGTTMALIPGCHLPAGSGRTLGYACGALSALGLGISGVVSRRAFTLDGAGLGGIEGGVAAAYLRNLGGLGCAFLALLTVPALVRWGGPITRLWQRSQAVEHPDWRAGWPWLAVSALVGPGLGVVCYQWALTGNLAGPVQAILATLPVVILPMAWWSEGDRPTPLAIVGGLVAVGGAVCLALRIGCAHPLVPGG
jgi:drug/metabolite transporter (DMT)-like permease